MTKKHFKLNDLNSYKMSFHLSNYVWDIVLDWDIFAKDTIGKQFVKSIDSISANIAEGFGRHTKKDRIKFYRYSKGSTMESLDWTEKAKRRKLLTKQQYEKIMKELQRLPLEINHLIKFTNDKLAI